MTFNQHLDSIQTLISTYNLNVTERQDAGHLVHDVRGTIQGKRVYIYVRYATNTIIWRDTVSGESKSYTY